MKRFIFYFVIFLSLMFNLSAAPDDSEDYTINEILVIDEDASEDTVEKASITSIEESEPLTKKEFGKIPVASINSINFLEYNYNGIVFHVNNIFTNKFDQNFELKYVDISLFNRANNEIAKYTRESRIDIPTNENVPYSYEMKITYDEFISADIEINTNINIYSLLGKYQFTIDGKKKLEESVYYPFRLQLPPIPQPTISVKESNYQKSSDKINITFDIKMYKPKGFTHLLVSNHNTLEINGGTAKENATKVSDILISTYNVVSFSVSYTLTKENMGNSLFLILKEGYDVNYIFSTDLIFKDPNDFEHTILLTYNGKIKAI